MTTPDGSAQGSDMAPDYLERDLAAAPSGQPQLDEMSGLVCPWPRSNCLADRWMCIRR